MLARAATEIYANRILSMGKMPIGPTGKMPVLQSSYARTGTDAVRSSLPQLTHAPFTPRKIAFQMQ